MRALISVLIFLCFSQYIFTQWYWQNPLPQGNNLRRVDFVDSQIVWAVGDAGTIIKSIDGGTTWVLQQNVTSNNLYAVSFLDENNGFVAGTNGIILKTTDGGLHWELKSSGTSFTLTGIAYLNINEIIIVGGLYGQTGPDGIIIKTSDSGKTWNTVAGTNDEITNVTFLTQNTIIAVSGTLGYPPNQWGAIHRSTDRGLSWSYCYGSSVRLNDVTRIDSNTVVASGYSGSVFKSMNEGISWVRNETGYAGSLNGVSFADNLNGTAVADNKILNTTDGGETWTQQSAGHYLWGIDRHSVNRGIIVGIAGEIFSRTEAGQWTQSSINVTGGRHLSGVFGTDYNIYTAVGDSGTILKTTDGGSDWIVQNSGITSNLTDVYFTDSNKGFAVGHEGKIVHTTDGGLNWIIQNSGTTEVLQSVYFYDENNGLAVGRRGTILKTTNAGATWLMQSVGVSISLSSLAFFDQNNGLATGYYLGDGIIMQTTDGGNSWTMRIFPETSNLTDAVCPNTNTCFLVGGPGAILKTTDKGITWSTMLSGSTLYFSGVSFADSLNGMAVGSNSSTYTATILRTTNGGVEWNQQFITSQAFNSVAFVDSLHCTMVGTGGAILHCTNGGWIPVDMISFTGSITNQLITLGWITNSELNNRGFQVQRKTKNSWEDVGFVQGHGTTTEKNYYSFKDDLRSSEESFIIFYRLKQVDFNGTCEYSKELEMEIAPYYNLSQNYPNPFNPVTRIKYAIAKETNVNISVYNILGERMAELKNETMKPGYYEVNFKAGSLPSGVYFYTLQTKGYSSTKKMILIK